MLHAAIPLRSWSPSRCGTSNGHGANGAARRASCAAPSRIDEPLRRRKRIRRRQQFVLAPHTRQPPRPRYARCIEARQRLAGIAAETIALGGSMLAMTALTRSSPVSGGRPAVLS
jgi:hypothetical protein